MLNPPFVPQHPLLETAAAFQNAGAFPRHTGTFGKANGMRVAIGKAPNLELSLLVDEEDGVIADAKFRAFGHPGLIAVAELISRELVRKTYDQARRLSGDILEKWLEKTTSHIPAAFFLFINHTLDAIIDAATKCMDIPLSEEILSSPVEFEESPSGPLPDWENLTDEARLRHIQTVLDVDIRPYIELDAGGIRIVELKNGLELVIAYEGACTSCPSSVGGTLDAITKILRSKVYPHLIIIPDSSFLQM